MCTPLIPARKGLQISKERGECSMLGKGGRERNYLVPHRQHKAYGSALHVMLFLENAA